MPQLNDRARCVRTGRSRLIQRLGSVLLWASAGCGPLAHAAGLWDPGFANGGWRSDYPDSDVGTAQSPLLLDTACAYPGVDFALCPSAFRPLPGVPVPPSVFARSNWHDEVTDPQGRFWVVGANTEPSAHDLCNSGPPNQSERVGSPLESVYGLHLGPELEGLRPYRRALVLALDLRWHWQELPLRPGCQTVDFIPYLGFGVADERGGGGVLASLAANEPDPVLHFSARVVASDATSFAAHEPVPPRPKGQHAGLLIEAQWQAHRRWVWIELFNTYDRADQTLFTPWNWALPQSFHYPGAEIVVTSGAALAQRCPSEPWELPDTAPAAWSGGDWKPVRLNLGALYRCVGALFSDPFPHDASAALTGAHFWVEIGVRDIDAVAGLTEGDFDSALAMGFSDVDLVPAGLAALDDADSFLDQVAGDLLGRKFTADEKPHWFDVLAREGKPGVVAQLLALPEVSRVAGPAILLQSLGWGEAADRPRFLRHRGALAQARLGRQLAREIVRDPRFARQWPDLPRADTIYRMLLAAEQGPLEEGSTSEVAALRQEAELWQRRMLAGKATAEDLLVESVRRSAGAPVWKSHIDVVLLYSALQERFPGAATLAQWRTRPDLPNSLIEPLLWSADYRNRFLPEAWQQR